MTTRTLRVNGWTALGFNVALTVMNIATGGYTAASVQTITVLLCVCLLWAQPRVEALLDAHLAKAQAQQRIAELALHAFEQQMRTGDVRVTVTPTDMRVN